LEIKGDFLKIRELEVGDANSYQALRLRALDEHPTAFVSSYEQQRDSPVSAVNERLSSSFDSPDGFILGCFVAERLVGTVGLYREESPKVVHKGWIVGMHVAAEHQGNGYGRALLLAALERARKIPKLELVQLGVESTNKQAMSLYSSLGFKTYGVEKRALQVNGEYFDEDLMALELG
jgi:RimJ/RimL family protein N-acetyltransferase